MLKRMILFCVVMLIAASLFLPMRRKSFAQGTVGYVGAGTITSLNTTYGANSVNITTTATVVTNGCTSNSGVYTTDVGNPGNQTQQAVLLGAFLSGKKITLALYGCNSSGQAIIDNIGVTP